MILKSYIVENNKDQLFKYRFFLFYGENDGLKKILKDYVKEKNEASETINLFQDEISKDNKKLEKHLFNTSLFEDKKTIIIHNATDKALEIIENIDEIDESIKIVLVSDILDKRSKLRSFFEKRSELAIVACYKDTEITLRNYISSELKGFKGLDHETIKIIISSSNLEREKALSTINKIKVLFKSKNIIKEKLYEILDINNNNSFEELRDASLLGNKIKLGELLGKTQLIQELSFLYLNQITSRLNKLLLVERDKIYTKNIDLALQKLKPPIFWKDKPIFINQLNKWNLEKLRIALKDSEELELTMKKNSIIKKETVLKKHLISLCVSASSSS